MSAGGGSGAVEKAEIVADVVGKHLSSALCRGCSQCCAGAIAASLHQHRGVATSPKMKWLSRSRQLRWPEVISGLTTSHAFRVGPRECSPPPSGSRMVAEEQATFMSNPNPSDPQAPAESRSPWPDRRAACSMPRTAPASTYFRIAPGPFQRLPRRCHAGKKFSAMIDNSSLPRSGRRGHITSGSRDRRLASSHGGALMPLAFSSEFDRGIGQRLGLASGDTIASDPWAALVAVNEGVEACHQSRRW